MTYLIYFMTFQKMTFIYIYIYIHIYIHNIYIYVYRSLLNEVTCKELSCESY